MTRRSLMTVVALVASVSACGSTTSKPAGGGGAGAGGATGNGATGGVTLGGVSGHAGVAGTAGSGDAGGRAGTPGSAGMAGGGGSVGGASGAGAGGHAGAAGGGDSGNGGFAGHASGGAGGQGGSSAGGAAGAALTVHELDVYGQRMIYDAGRARLYVSAGSQAKANANTIEVVDAVGETILSTIPIGKDPGPLALSDDGTTLWVSLGGDYALRSVDLTATPPTVNPEHPLGTLDGVLYDTVRTLLVLPGTRTSVVASVGGTVFVFDDGVPRADHGNRVTTADRLALGPSGYVFGDNTETTGYDFTSFSIGATGVQMVADVKGLILSNVEDILYWSSRVYGYWGEVIDVSDPSKPKRAGKFDFQGAIAGRDATHLLMMSWSSLIGANTPQAMRVLDTTTFTQSAFVTVPTTLVSSASEFLDLCYLGGDRAAFLTEDYESGNRLFFIESPVIAP